MGFVMKKYIFFIFTLMQPAYFSDLSCCPCSFSLVDQRPFFEQYDIKNTSDTPQIEEEQ
jgi:hypothetical protein